MTAVWISGVSWRSLGGSLSLDGIGMSCSLSSSTRRHAAASTNAQGAREVAGLFALAPGASGLEIKPPTRAEIFPFELPSRTRHAFLAGVHEPTCIELGDFAQCRAGIVEIETCMHEQEANSIGAGMHELIVSSVRAG